MKKLPLWIRANPVLPWAVLFLLLTLSVTQYGGTNALSRIAAMRAITEGHTLNIDNYKGWTIDWSLAPNGHYYSNKAPGAAFLALPAFALTEIVSLPLGHRSRDEFGRAPAPGYEAHLAIVFSIQLIPLFLLVLWISQQMLAAGLPLPAVHFFALAAFFGNTAALYMGTHFGHGLAAILFLSACWCWWRQRYALAGLALSWCLLTDYGTAFAIPFFLLATLWRDLKFRPIFQIALGALPGALVWIAYHWIAFGSPFATANQFINPEQIERAPGSTGLWNPIPSIEILDKIFFGPERGFLFQQPWVFFTLFLPFIAGLRGSALLALGSLAGLLWMNAGFGSWHGGWCLGPRYISLVLPSLALAIALAWESYPRWARPGLWAALAMSLLYRILVFPFSNLAPNENLWLYHLAKFLDVHKGTNFLRLGMALAFSGLAFWWWRRRRRAASLFQQN